MRSLRRVKIALIGAIAVLFVFAVLFYLAPRPHSAVLMYHLILDEPYTDHEYLYVRPADFEAQLQALVEAGYAFYFASEYPELPATRGVILTFDDGYEDNYTQMLPILARYNAKATVFVASGLVGQPGYLSQEQLALLAADPHIEIGSHTASHCVLTELNSAEVERELRLSQEQLRSLTGQDITTFSYPQGKADATVRELSTRYYAVSFTTNDRRHFRFTPLDHVPRITVRRDMDGAELLQRLRDWRL